MRGIHRLSALTITLLAVLLASACDSSEPAAPKATAKEILSGAESGEAATGMDPCALLSDAQVAEVLPGAKAGMNTHSGGSLIDGVDAYQCTWINDSADMLTVILNVARNAERFADIRPGDGVRRSGTRSQPGESKRDIRHPPRCWRRCPQKPECTQSPIRAKRPPVSG